MNYTASRHVLAVNSTFRPTRHRPPDHRPHCRWRGGGGDRPDAPAPPAGDGAAADAGTGGNRHPGHGGARGPADRGDCGLRHVAGAADRGHRRRGHPGHARPPAGHPPHGGEPALGAGPDDRRHHAAGPGPARGGGPAAGGRAGGRGRRHLRRHRQARPAHPAGGISRGGRRSPGAGAHPLQRRLPGGHRVGDGAGPHLPGPRRGDPRPRLGGRDAAPQPGWGSDRLGTGAGGDPAHRHRRQRRRAPDAAGEGGPVPGGIGSHHRPGRRLQQDRDVPEGAGRPGPRRAVLCRAAGADHRLRRGGRSGRDPDRGAAGGGGAAGTRPAGGRDRERRGRAGDGRAAAAVHPGVQPWRSTSPRRRW